MGRFQTWFKSCFHLQTSKPFILQMKGPLAPQAQQNGPLGGETRNHSLFWFFKRPKRSDLVVKITVVSDPKTVV